jgi:hypothetical protein
VRLGIKIPAAGLGALAAALVLLTVGCGTRQANTAQGNTVQGCASYGVQAIEHHVTVTRTPQPCHGLSPAQINQAAGMAIIRVAGGAPKAVWRKRAAQAARYLGGLVTTIPSSPNSAPAAAALSGTVAGPIGGRDARMDIAALIAWLVTAASGLYVLRNWMSHGGSLRPRSDATGASGSPPAVIVGHFGLATAGLVIWIAYLVAGWNALAWIAVAALLPVAGLGMAALAIGLPASATATSTGAPDPAPASAAAGGVGVLPARRVKRRLSPLLVVAHGALAVTTITLVLLAAIGT